MQEQSSNLTPEVVDNVALFDLDGSLCDFEGQLLRDLLRLHGPNEPPITDLWVAEKLPHIQERMRLIKSMPGWWFKLPPLYSGMAIYKTATDLGFHNEILTKGPDYATNAWTEKKDWCIRYFGRECDVHITCNKARVYGKVLYDDYMPFMEAWLSVRPRGLGIMPRTNNNKDFQHPNVVIFDGKNFPEVEAAMKIALARKPGEMLVLPNRPPYSIYSVNPSRLFLSYAENLSDALAAALAYVNTCGHKEVEVWDKTGPCYTKISERKP